MNKQQVVTDAEKLFEKGEIDLLILNRQPHRCLLDLAKLYGIRGVGKMKREDLINKIFEVHRSSTGAEIRQNQFLNAIGEKSDMGIIPDVQDPAEVEAIAVEQENWRPTKPPLTDKWPDASDTIVVHTSKGDYEELSQSFVDALDAKKTTKAKKPRSAKASTTDKFKSDGGIEQRVKQAGIKTPQVLVCARAADTFDESFDLNQLAAKADELGLITKQGPLFIVKYYLSKLMDAGLVAL